MKHPLFDHYADEVARRLRGSAASTTRLRQEILDHLEDGADALLSQGEDREAAAGEAIRRAGPAASVARQHNRSTERTLTLWLAPIAALLGGAVTYVDSSPGWDDTGITAGAILLLAGTFSLVAPRRPWLWALLFGGGIPLVAYIRHTSPTAMLALIIALVASVVGSVLRRVTDPEFV